MALQTVTLVPSRTWRANQSPMVSPARAWPSQVPWIEVRIVTTDFSSASQQATFTLERTLDGGATWDYVASGAFIGGVHPRRGTPIQPNMTFTPDSSELLAPFSVRLRLELVGPSFTGPLVMTWETA